jgi:hypothetical protein
MSSQLDELLAAVKTLHTDQAQILSAVASISQRIDRIEQHSHGGNRLESASPPSVGNERMAPSMASAVLGPEALTKTPPLLPLDDSAMSGGRGSPVSKSGFTSRIILTTYPKQIGIHPLPMNWGAADPVERGPVTVSRASSTIRRRNAIGAHSGSYSIYYALALASRELKADHKPDFTNTEPAVNLGPFPQWHDPKKIVAMDPWGHLVPSLFKDIMDKENRRFGVPLATRPLMALALVPALKVCNS